MPNPTDIYPLIHRALMAEDIDTKLAEVAAQRAGWLDGSLRRVGDDTVVAVPVPGRPVRPTLVPSSQLLQRKLSTQEGHAALVHAIAHIEFNAINLALDAAWRFRDLPDAFLADWLQVAAEEAQHFAMLRERLQSLGFDYGDFPAHNGLWQMTCKTDHDPLVRMALVPRILEARGLDVTPGIQRKLTGIGDTATVAVLDVIYHDEVGHVQVGNYWFTRLCDERGMEPLATFRQLVADYDVYVFKGGFNREARLRAGFSEFELKMLEDFSVVRDPS
ncbi:ferritin-like domain-containing protein [Crenobacter sp. SG2303]|uniref:Ferritin-like domain-containing protein n=1 Tax=Crenobacter oryzisoli TaxID=3056844 RepID=A0ABT7XKD4_9NEIS|nr:ferritin-like domain-containing protein [Crenobacter sp. SG2303]MDN0074233.1 ferritin-like domain-containing protein [Crenobacter sp. SG2303]